MMLSDNRCLFLSLVRRGIGKETEKDRVMLASDFAIDWVEI